MKKILTIICLIFVLSACSVLSGKPGAEADLPGGSGQNNPPGAADHTPTPIMPPTLSGDISVQQLMLNSSNQWKTLQASYTVTTYPSSGSSSSEPGAQPDIKVHQIWIRLPAEFKVMINSPKEGPIMTKVSNGEYILESNGDRTDLPPDVFQPFNPPTELSDTVVLHPLAGLLGTPVSDLIFPAGLAQRGGEYQVTGEEIVAGRQAIVVEWSREPGKLIDRLWVDKQTGVILRQQNYGKEDSVSPINDYLATYISYNSEIDDSIFGLGQVPTPTPTPIPPTPVDNTARVTILPKVLNVREGPNTNYRVVATVETGKVLRVIGRTDNNEWWKVQLEGDKTGWVLALYVEFSGDEDKVPVVNY